MTSLAQNPIQRSVQTKQMTVMYKWGGGAGPPRRARAACTIYIDGSYSRAYGRNRKRSVCTPLDLGVLMIRVRPRVKIKLHSL